MGKEGIFWYENIGTDSWSFPLSDVKYGSTDLSGSSESGLLFEGIIDSTNAPIQVP